MSVNDLFLDDEGVEGTRVKLAAHQDNDKNEGFSMGGYAPIRDRAEPSIDI